MGTFKDNQNGFSIFDVVLLIIVIVLIGCAGWLVYKDHSKAQTQDKAAKTLKAAQTSKVVSGKSTAAGPNKSQYAGWQTFCSSYGGLCLKYPSNWKLSQATYAVGSNIFGQEIDTITSPSTSVTITYRPSALDTGDRRQEAIKVVRASLTANSNLEVLQLIDELSGSPTEYAVEDYVTLASAAHALNKASTAFTPGAVIDKTVEPPYHQFTNPVRPDNIGQQLLAVTIDNGDPGSNFFSSDAAAQAWLSSSEVVTAGQILNSVTYSQ